MRHGAREWPGRGAGPEPAPPEPDHGRPQGEEADAAWFGVCFRAGGSGAGAGGSVLAVWTSDTAHGTVRVSSGEPSGPARSGVAGPPARCAHGGGGFPCDVHLRADPDAPFRSGLAHYADVLVGGVPLPASSACRRVHELLTGYPGVLVVAVPVLEPGRALVGVRGEASGPRLLGTGAFGAGGLSPAGTAASVMHAWVAAGRPPGALRSVSPPATGTAVA
ncbi:hypothetical protein [Streptomyces nitrosporeus]|uniref:hypothetical protein n=1 Tax=Streptomyces nitrosporeus TaxID=28894 RepID=UPI0039A33B84